MSQKRTEKRRKVIYRDKPDEKAAELEEFLFGSKADAAAVFSKRVEADSDDDLTLTDLLAPGGALFFEDKGGHSSPQAYSSDDEDLSTEAEGSGDSSGDEDQAQGESSSSDRDEEEEQQEAQPDERQQQAGGAGASTSEPATGPGAAPAASGKRRQPVWVDPADGELKVNLAGKSRLRKLRTNNQQETVDGSTYEAALRKQHAVLHPRTSWASLNTKGAAGRRGGAKRAAGEEEDGEDEEVDGLLTQAGGLLAGRSLRLPPGTIETSRLKDGNVAEPSKAVMQSVGWHPSGQLLMTAGLDKKLRLFKVDGGENPLVQAVFLHQCPIHQAAWASGGAQVIAAGRRPHFFLYDLGSGKVERIQPGAGNCPQPKSLESFATTLPGSTGPGGHMVAFCGDQGYVPLVSLSTRQWVANLKMSGSVRCAAWAPGGQQLLTLGGDGIVYTWEMRMRQCISQLRDHANIRPTCLAISPDGRYIATGSESGAVNVYPGPTVTAGSDTLELLGSAGSRATHRPPSALKALGSGAIIPGKPIKEVLNLVTSVDSLTFSHDSQMLAFSSRMKKDAMRLLHLPSCTVFANWPTSRSPLHYVHSLAFSPHSGFLTIGNAKGRALLYRLHHYQEA